MCGCLLRLLVVLSHLEVFISCQANAKMRVEDKKGRRWGWEEKETNNCEPFPKIGNGHLSSGIGQSTDGGRKEQTVPRDLSRC